MHNKITDYQITKGWESNLFQYQFYVIWIVEILNTNQNMRISHWEDSSRYSTCRVCFGCLGSFVCFSAWWLPLFALFGWPVIPIIMNTRFWPAFWWTDELCRSLRVWNCFALRPDNIPWIWSATEIFIRLNWASVHHSINRESLLLTLTALGV